MKSIYFEVNVAKIVLTKLAASVFPDVYYSRLSPIRYADIPTKPMPGENWIRVKNRLAGICGADMALFFVQAHPKISIAALPGVPRVFMGHELSGEIIETGKGVRDLSVGDRVVLQKYLPCCSMKEIDPPCAECQAGNYTLCENFSEGPRLPDNLGAGFGEQCILHRSQVIRVPESMPDSCAVMVEPASVSLHAVLKRPPAKGEKVLLIGAGVIGLNVIQFAKVIQPGCTIHVLDKLPFKKERARAMGADVVFEGDPYDEVRRYTGAHLYTGALANRTLVGGFDCIYDCVGYSSTVNDSLRWLKARGDYVLIGNQLSPVTFDMTPLWQQEVRMVGVNAHGTERFNGESISSFDLVLRMYSENKIRLNEFVTHRFPLSEYARAFRTIRGGREKIIKAVLEME
ncbi:MAG: zinc-binding dehydrogenase [Desulfomonilia bacterium]|nr:zinc-binding dehydrogenase [Desulfomonilia bacterium]